MSVAPPIHAAVPLTLGRKACAALIFACALTVLVGVFTFGLQMRLYQLIGRAARQDAASRSAASELVVSIVQCQRYEKDLLRNLGNPSALRAAEEHWSCAWHDLRDSLHELQATSWNAAEREQLESYLAAAGSYRENLRQLSDAVRHGRITSRDEAERTLARNKNDARPTIAEAVVFAQRKIDLAAQTGQTLASSACFSFVLTGAMLLLPCGLMLSGMIWLSGVKAFSFRRGAMRQSNRIAAVDHLGEPDIVTSGGRPDGIAPPAAEAAIRVGQTLHPDECAESRLLDSLRTIAAEVAQQTQPTENRPGPLELPIPLANDAPVAH